MSPRAALRILSGPLMRLRESPARAAELSETKASGKYACGFSAWEKWIQGLKDNKPFEKATTETLRGMMRGNFRIRVAGGCARRRGRLPAPGGQGVRRAGTKAGEHLLKAAGAYTEMVEKALARKCPVEIAPPPLDAKSALNWAPATRAEEAAVLEKALESERRAVVEIQAAWAAM